MKEKCLNCANRPICEVYEEHGISECFGYEQGPNVFPFEIGDLIYAAWKTRGTIEVIKVESEYDALHFKSHWNRIYFPTLKAAKLALQQ